MIAKLISAKVALYAIGGAFLIGTFGGGYGVHKLWLGKAAQKALAIEKAALSATQSALDESNRLATLSAESAERESSARIEAERRLSQAYMDNATLAASRASTSTRVIQEAQEIGQNLKTDYPCLYEPWPRELRNFAFGLGAPVNMPRPTVSGYPAPE